MVVFDRISAERYVDILDEGMTLPDGERRRWPHLTEV